MEDALFPQYRDIVPEFDRFQEVLRSPLPTHLRINRLKAEPGLVRDALRDKGIRLEPSCPGIDTLFNAGTLESPGTLIEYFLGSIHPQALTSCLASLVLAPAQGAYVLDMCASPGGKTAHMAEFMGNTGLIVANELFPARHISLGHTLARLGVANAVLTGYQAQEFPLRHRFRYILADVPCSGEGMFRKTREGQRHRDSGGKPRLAELQRKMILRGFDLLDTGGEMLYSTCTYDPEENESVVQHLLEHRDAALLPITVDPRLEPGITRWRHHTYDGRIAHTARFYPHRFDSVGFFMAKIGRPR